MRSSYPHNQSNFTMNLSKHNLIPIEENVLKLGHSFVQRPAALNTERTKQQLQPIVTEINILNKIIDDIAGRETASILNPSLIKTRKDLKNNKNIVITLADKGDTWVILDRDDYVWECNRQLRDASTYRLLPNDQTFLTCKLLRKVLLNMLSKKLISTKTFEELVPKEQQIKQRVFYTLPKIHKPKSTWYEGERIPPGRPIVGNCNSEDTQICKFIDSFLRPIVAQQPHILSNTDQLLTAIEDIKIEDNSILFSLDVNSLYTNIPIIRGIEIVKEYFEKYPQQKRPDQHILELLKIALLKNDFYFNGQHFRQIKGVSMGKQFGPNFANLYMCKWENHVLNNLAGKKPSLWLRYIDDIFGVWNGPLEELQQFIYQANDFDPNIQLTCNSSLSDIQFLASLFLKIIMENFQLQFILSQRPLLD